MLREGLPSSTGEDLSTWVIENSRVGVAVPPAASSSLRRLPTDFRGFVSAVARNRQSFTVKNGVVRSLRNGRAFKFSQPVCALQLA